MTCRNPLGIGRKKEGAEEYSIDWEGDIGSQSRRRQSQALKKMTYPNNEYVKRRIPSQPVSATSNSSKKTRMPNNVKTYDESDDPEDHLKIFQAPAKVERWAMPTWCHMFNSTLTESAKDHVRKQNFDRRRDFRIQQRSERKRDKFTLLTKSPKQFLALDKGKFKALPLMTTPVDKRNNNKFCEFHGEVRHSTDECMHLRKQIEELIKSEKFPHMIKELKQGSGKDQPKAAKKGETSRKDKPLSILMVQPWQKVARQRITQSFSPGPKISFPPLGKEDGTEGLMIIEAEIGGHFIHRIYVDGGSTSEILYKHSFNRLHPKEAGGKENSSSTINSSRNAKIPSSRRNTYSVEQHDNFTRMHDGLWTGSTDFQRHLGNRRKNKDDDDDDDDKPREEYGVVGIYGDPKASRLCYLALYALQHRGQEGAGIVTATLDGLVYEEHDFDAKKPESEVSVSLSSSAQSRKQDDKIKKEAKGKSHVESFTGYRDLSAEFEDCSDNSINEVNPVGFIVSTVRQNSPNSTNTFSDAELKDITHSDNEDDVGAEADFNNLETSITISVIPTTRVYKDNHVSQIIGDLSSTTQTRSMTRVVQDQCGLSQMFNDDFHTWFEDLDHPDNVYKVVKALYGLHQAPRACQDKYAAEILRKFRLTKGKSASTPIDTEKPLLKDPDGEDVDVHTYRSMIGSLMYLTSSRPAIMFAVCACARFKVTPKASHLHAVKRIFRYLKGKPHLGLWYPKDSPFNLVAYSDSDYAGVNTPRSDEDRLELMELIVFLLTKVEKVGIEVNAVDLQVSAVRHMFLLFSLTNWRCSLSAVSLVRNVDSTTKFYMYPRFLHLIIRKQVGDISTHTTKYTSPDLTQKVFTNMRRVRKGFSWVETPLFEGMLVEQEIDEEGDAAEHVEEVNTGDAAEGDDIQPTSPQPQPQQAANFPMSLLQEVMDACAALTRRVEHIEFDKVAQALEITKLKKRVKKLERRNKVRVLKLRRLQKVGTSQRVETFDDTVMDDESNQGRMIAKMDQDDVVVLEDDKEEDKDVVDAVKDVEKAKVNESAKYQGRQAESQAKIYKIDMDHANKVLSIQEDETEPAEVQEVVDVVTTAKLITKVVTAARETVTAASAIITTTEAQVPAATTALLLLLKVPAVDYEIIEINNKPYYKIIRVDARCTRLNLEESKKCTWSSKGQELKATGIMWCEDHNFYNHIANFVSGKECCQAKLMLLVNAAEKVNAAETN
uniref:Uncharacterized mitochondrial protein AtMg00810-like n=1 Tax=Tanacetum cinerariifolium TaxID=118510 RepID=A0A6L2P4G9_TANCI|nr:uncharacterized mitochondrial protein AtMg00810-like [Tanacetum cinerariifolium]